MADFTMDTIGALLSGGGVKAISKRTKLPVSDVAKVMSYGIPTLLGGMNRNVETSEGEQSLASALRDHSADDVSNVGAFLKGSDLKDGKKIIAHVLAGDQDDVVEQISRASGVSTGKTISILALLAPLLLSLLGGQQNQGGSSFSLPGLLLSTLLGGGSSQSSGGSLLGSLLGGGQTQQQSSSGLFSSLLGGGQTQQTQQVQQQSSGGLFSSLFGGGQTQQTQAVQQQQSSGSLFSSLFGGGSQSGSDLVLSEKPEETAQQAIQQGQQSLLSTLLGGGSQAQAEPAQEEEDSGFLSGLLNLFH